jgi:hypothetical protein
MLQDRIQEGRRHHGLRYRAEIPPAKEEAGQGGHTLSLFFQGPLNFFPACQACEVSNETTEFFAQAFQKGPIAFH